jgi:phosphoglycolate phosphatase
VELRDRAEEFRSLCIDEEVREVLQRGRFFDGIEELLVALRARGAKIALVTNGGTRYIGAVAERLDYARLLDGIYHFGKDGLSRKSEMIARARKELGGESVVMIGDRSSDVEGAREAGVPSILCRYGFGSPEESLGADVVVEAVEELHALLLPGGLPGHVRGDRAREF